jgi:GNAT superfamily N-acetyltransferase
MTEVTTYYLEMKSASALIDSTAASGLEIVECEIKQFPFNRFLYQMVGSAWQWTDKNAWTDAQWQAFAEDDHLRTWVGYLKGSPAGYFELQQQRGGHVEIAYFGLAPRFIGQGLGGCLLARAIKSAWDWEGTRRVWVHTCTLDHPHALSNYQARGLVVYKVATTERTIIG